MILHLQFSCTGGKISGVELPSKIFPSCLAQCQQVVGPKAEDHSFHLSLSETFGLNPSIPASPNQNCCNIIPKSIFVLIM
jgi:hypothetical protein